MPRPSKSEKWPEHGPLKVFVEKGQAVYTCRIDSQGRPSTTSAEHTGKTCTVIIHDEEG